MGWWWRASWREGAGRDNQRRGDWMVRCNGLWLANTLVLISALLVPAAPGRQKEAPKPRPGKPLDLRDYSSLVWAPDGKSLVIQADRYEEAGPLDTPNWYGRRF